MKSPRFLTAFAFTSVALAVVQLDIGQIPVFNGTEFPFLSLGPPAKIPDQLLKQIITTTSPNATLTFDNATGGSYAYDGDRLVAVVHPKTGEAKVFPNLANLQPAPGPIIDTSQVFHYLSLNLTFPVDHTNISVVNGSSLFGLTSTVNQTKGGPTELFLTHASVQRNISLPTGQAFSVCGPGSQASFGVGLSGFPSSLSYRWKPATLTGRTVVSNNTDVVLKSIVRQLDTSTPDTFIRVDDVDLCFYDGGLDFIQPVYRYTATVHANVTKGPAAPARFIGYISIGNFTPEVIPPLRDPGADPKSIPTFSNSTVDDRPRALATEIGLPAFDRRGTKPNLKVGRYVVRDDDPYWVTNANNFYANLQGPWFPFGLFGGLFSIANFVNSQYYWAEPRLFTNQKNSFINSVHIAETEVHGNWHFFTTEKNCCDGVNIETDIPSDGYGGGAKGSLAYWIIHSCEVIPTPADYSATDFHKAFDPWWTVFNGLHAVVGYRTEMWIADGVMPTFGTHLALGAPFVSAWLQAVHDDTAHYLTNGKPQLYHDGNRGIDEPMGRPAAVVVCGHEGDIVTQVENIGRPSCLREFWYNN